jgi:hypothetical protein
MTNVETIPITPSAETLPAISRRTGFPEPEDSCIRQPLVRPYTQAEREMTNPFKPEETKHMAMTRWFATAIIDTMRYQDAIIAHPDKREHFQRLIGCAAQAALGYGKVHEIDTAEVEQAMREAQEGVDWLATNPN